MCVCVDATSQLMLISIDLVSLPIRQPAKPKKPSPPSEAKQEEEMPYRLLCYQTAKSVKSHCIEKGYIIQ